MERCGELFTYGGAEVSFSAVLLGVTPLLHSVGLVKPQGVAQAKLAPRLMQDTQGMQILGRHELVSWKQPSIPTRMEVLRGFETMVPYTIYIAVSTAFWGLCTCVYHGQAGECLGLESQ